MRIFKHCYFNQWAETEKISDDTLVESVNEMSRGLFDGHLGNGLYKKRVAIRGKGKRGGYRIIIAFKVDSRAIFIYGFQKNARSNISKKEKSIYRQLALELLELGADKIQVMVEKGTLVEVKS